MIKYLHKLGGMNMANICLIDDEKALNQVLKTYLERDGHPITAYKISIGKQTGIHCMIFILLTSCFQMVVAPN